MCSSCGKTTYTIKQAVGQLSLEFRGEDNAKLLASKDTSKYIKEKIKKIEKYKNFFYQYFKIKPTDIYTETTILENDAVSYLVIASPINEVKPLKHWFPFVGEFPYLGFFDKSDALDFQKDLSTKYFTYVRPVYAYSTLNQLPFYDNILSSFFFLDDYALAELIFHELTHTVLFVKDDVNFNESFAQYIGEELAIEYFKLTPQKIKQLRKKEMGNKELRTILAKFVNDYNDNLKEKKPTSKLDALIIMKDIYESKYSSSYTESCRKYRSDSCKLDLSKWNNARMAEFLTYQSKQSLVQKLQEKKKFNLHQLMAHIQSLEDSFDGQEKTFSKYIKSKEGL